MLRDRFENLVENFTLWVAVIVAALITAMIMYFATSAVQETIIPNGQFIKESVSVESGTGGWETDTTSWKKSW